MNFDLVRRVLAEFEAERVEYVERLKTALKTVFQDPAIDEITSQDLLGDYPAVQYVPPEGSFYLDILTRLGEVQLGEP